MNTYPLSFPHGTSADEALSVWKDQFFMAIDRFVPERKTKVIRRAPWISCDIVYAIKKKKSFWRKKGSGSSSPAVLETFRRIRQRIKNWTRANRKAHLFLIASDLPSNPKPFWSFFKTKSKCSSFPETMLLDDNTAVSSDQGKALATVEPLQVCLLH